MKSPVYHANTNVHRAGPYRHGYKLVYRIIFTLKWHQELFWWIISGRKMLITQPRMIGSGSWCVWAVLASWIAEVNLPTHPTKEAANKSPFCIQFAFQSCFGWNNKLIQFANIYLRSPLPLYPNSSWRLYYFSNWVIYSCTFEFALSYQNPICDI